MVGSKKRTYSGDGNKARFVDLALSSTEEKDLKSAKLIRPQWTSAFNEIIVAGYKLTFKEDSRTHSVMAMVQDADYDPRVAPTIYVVRGGSVESAMVKLAWYWRTSNGTLPDPDAAMGNAEDDDDLFA